MKKLLSLPPNLVHCFHELEGVDTSEWFCTSDPIGAKLGSGGGQLGCCKPVMKIMLPESPSRGGWKTKKNIASRRWTKSPPSRICSFRKDIDSDTCF